MGALELAAAGIVLLYVVVRARREPEPIAFLRRLGLLAVAAWAGEESMILAYGFYAYSPEWSVAVDRVPLMIALIWPVVICSAHDIARRLAGGPVRIALVAGGIVLADAALIEPIAVRAGLWRWTEPGLFDVPPVGILGWVFFAAMAVYLIERKREAWVLIVPGLLAHAGVIASWWGALRWVSATLPDWPVAGAAACLSAGLTALVLRGRLRLRLPPDEMLPRLPAAAFFFVLLALHGGDAPALVTYALAFAPPYVALTDWARLLGRIAQLARSSRRARSAPS